jgi:hypothetical protein
MAADLRKIAAFVPEAGRSAVVYSGRTAGTVDGIDIVNFADTGA